MAANFGDKTALVTGAASGIGRAASILLAREGAQVIAADLDEAGAQATAERIEADGGRAFALRLDVRVETDWERAFAVPECGPVNIMVACAGISFAAPVTETKLEDWRGVMAVNLDGVFLGTKHAIRAMRSHSGGSIVLVSSLSGLKPSAGASAYCASKAALTMFARTAALECAENGDNIRINTVAPGGVKTPMWRSMGFFQDLIAEHGSEEAAFAAMEGERKPLQRFVDPEEVARAILFLASDEASAVTGTELIVGGAV